MPADTKAIAYDWFMTDDPNDRILKFRWEPEGGVITSSMGMGKLVLYVREELSSNEAIVIYGPEWKVGKDVGEIPWVVAQRIARDQGFHIEVPIYS